VKQATHRDWVAEYDGRLSAAGHSRSAKARISSLRDYYVGRPVLVTGGASFIGSHLVELLVAAGAIVRVADDLSSGRLDHLATVRSGIRFDRGDLRDPAFARDSVAGSSVVFHLAAAHGGRGYIDSHPVECLNNISLDHSVFSAAADAGVQKVVFASSACVYPTQLQASDRDRQLLRETDAGFDEGATNPDGEYGWAKLTGELQLRAFHRQHGMSGVACRIFTSYGERENETARCDRADRQGRRATRSISDLGQRPADPKFHLRSRHGHGSCSRRRAPRWLHDAERRQPSPSHDPRARRADLRVRRVATAAESPTSSIVLSGSAVAPRT